MVIDPEDLPEDLRPLEAEEGFESRDDFSEDFLEIHDDYARHRHFDVPPEAAAILVLSTQIAKFRTSVLKEIDESARFVVDAINRGQQ